MVLVRDELARKLERRGARRSRHVAAGASQHGRLREALRQSAPILRALLKSGRFRSHDAETWAGIPYLGLVPKSPSGPGDLGPAAGVVEHPESAFAAAFRRVRDQLLRSQAIRVVALTSAFPNDGKTTCSISLARQCALDGYKTVLVDCDLRRGSSTAEFGRLPQLGLLEVIEGRCRLEDALSRDQLTPLFVLPVVRDLDAIMRATVQDAFGKSEMGDLMSDLKQRFDYVFIDTPPVLAVVDARSLAPLVDGFLFLTRSRRTPKKAVRQAIDLLKHANAPVAGLVLTHAPTRSSRFADLKRWAGAILARTLGKID